VRFSIFRGIYASNGEPVMATVDQRYDEAIELQQAGKLEEAVGKLEGLVADFPDYALGHSALAAFYGHLDRHDEAIEQARKVCQLEPDDPFSYMALSLLAQRAGQLPVAEEALATAAEKQWAASKGQ
jgi:predicted Zn-dependent protease